jgi:CubicO group peptidase (beta-lactamase class C family)
LPFADACRGLARVLTPTIAEQAMTPDTIIHLASMSKSITSTALVAMKEDWQAIADLVAQLKAGQSVPHTTYSLQIPFNPGHPPPPPAPFDFPDVLAPLLVDRSFRSEMQSAGALNGMPFSVTAVFRRFDLVGPFTLSPTPAIMPWHAGLLRQVLTGVPVIDYDQKFLPLFKHDIDIDHEVGNGVFDITIRQLLNHKTYLFGIHDALHSADEQAAYANHQPALTGLPGPGVPTPIATIDNRAQVKALLREGGGPFPAGSYQNWNYSVVGRIIEICTGMNLDDYQNARLLADPRFANIRRHVVDPAAACLYYGGPGPAFTGGVTFPDFSQWGGAGGFYGPASQLTDWLYALAARQPVSGLNGVAPLVSAAGIDALFKGGMFFSGGGARPIPGGKSVGYEKNGGTGLSDPATGKGGAANGKFGVYFGPGSAIYTVFFGANADHPADRPYDDAVFLLCSSSFWT